MFYLLLLIVALAFGKLKKPARLRAAITTVPQNFPPLQFCSQPAIFTEMCVPSFYIFTQ